MMISVTAMATRSSTIVNPTSDCLRERCIEIPLLKARNVSGNRVVAHAPTRCHLHRHADLPYVGTYVPRGVKQRLNQDLALKVAQRNDFVVGGVHHTVFPGQYLPVQDCRLPLCAHDPVRSGKE